MYTHTTRTHLTEDAKKTFLRLTSSTLVRLTLTCTKTHILTKKNACAYTQAFLCFISYLSPIEEEFFDIFRYLLQAFFRCVFPHMPANASEAFLLFSTVEFWRMHYRAYEKGFTATKKHRSHLRCFRFLYFSINSIIGATSSKEWG